jgi:hypothetical protein
VTDRSQPSRFCPSLDRAGGAFREPALERAETDLPDTDHAARQGPADRILASRRRPSSWANLSAHTVEAAREFICLAGAALCYLPSYSPDPTPSSNPSQSSTSSCTSPAKVRSKTSTILWDKASTALLQPSPAATLGIQFTPQPDRVPLYRFALDGSDRPQMSA